MSWSSVYDVLMLTVQEVVDRVQAIGPDPDPEAAHWDEDNLWWEVLSAIATGECEDPVLLATAALETRRLDFPRWYA
jgi:hypothetical protein